ESCHASKDCCNGVPCKSPEDPAVCGMCRPVESECGDGSPCATGSVCVTATAPPCACEPTMQKCVESCATAGCPDYGTCGADGEGVPASCPTFTCPDWMDCAHEGGDEHHCVSRACVDDSTCGHGACVNATCASAAGTCFVPPD